jgi:phage N-6-adenine-methyltransferase
VTLRRDGGLPGPHVVHGMARSDEWETPLALFDQLHREFGFTLDAAADHLNAKCALYFSAMDDGLSQDWGSHVVWLNPPYGREIGKWVRKAWLASLHGATVVCLVPSRTDTAWWHDYAMRGDVRFLRGRVNFVGRDRKGHNSPFPSALLVFRPLSGTRAASEGEA